MKFNTAVLAVACTAATVTSALPMPPAGSCIVDLNGSPYTTLALRSTPCNDKAPLAWLSNGQSVKQYGTATFSGGCGYEYYMVQYTNPSTGKSVKGYVGTDYVNCGSNIPTPPPPTNTQTCGSWAVTLGGSPNACGADWHYTAGDSDTCSSSGSNCQSNCCTKTILY